MGWDECVFNCGHNATFRMPGHPESGICGCCLLFLKKLLTLTEEEIVLAADFGKPNCTTIINREGVLDISEYKQEEIPNFIQKYNNLIEKNVPEEQLNPNAKKEEK